MDKLMKLIQEMGDQPLCIENMLHLGASFIDYRVPDKLAEILEQEDENFLVGLFPRASKEIKALVELEGEHDTTDLEDLVYSIVHTHKYGGYLVQFACPVKSKIPGGGASYSWGYYGTRWVYSETLEGAITEGLAWSKEQEKKDLTKKH